MTPSFHPHSGERSLVRSVQVGRSRFSRCCHLLVDLYFISKDEVGPGDRRSHRNSALGSCFSFLSDGLVYAAAGIALCCAAIRMLLRSPTSDAATPRAFWRLR